MHPHSTRTKDSSQKIPLGFCQCGCGALTSVAKYTDPKAGYIKGQPLRFVTGHYKREPRPLLERLMEKVEIQPNGCWIWTGRINERGYGRIDVKGRSVYAHRLSYELHIGPIPDGMEACHNCPEGDDPSCINPAHLWLGTQADNLHDMYAKGRWRPGKRLGGEQNPSAKLTASQVEQIRSIAQTGAMTHLQIAEIFGVARPTISQIIKGDTWKNMAGQHPEYVEQDAD